jgi:hypothetical protein
MKLIGYSLIAVMILGFSCKKGTNTITNTGGGNTGGGNTGGTVPPPVDPPVANTVGFFLDDWQPKNFIVPSFVETSKPTASPTSVVTIDASSIITKIPKSIYGENANSWMTQIITEPNLLNNINNLHAGVIRFPGGSTSDVYFWNQSSAPPADAPSTLIDANGNTVTNPYWFGKNTASWTISVDSYYSLLQQTGNNGMITVNYGYARYGTSSNPVASAAHLAADWVRYDNGRTKYWEIGNECNGTWEAGYRINTANNKDGQPEIVNGALYAEHVKVFIDSMKQAASEIGKTIYIGAYILETQPQSWQTATDQTWNQGVFSHVNNQPDFYIVHSYYTPYQSNSSASLILDSASSNTINMMTYVKANMIANGANVKPIALTEWNFNAEGSKQKVSFISGVFGTILLGEALKNHYGETSRWDLANAWQNGNDHGMFNIGDEPGVTKWNPRPSFYYLYYFQRMIGDRLLSTNITGGIMAYASSFTSGQKAVILVNKSTIDQTVNVSLNNATPGARFYWYTLTGGTDNGEFSQKVFINGTGPTEVTGGPSNYADIKANSAVTSNGILVSVPSRGVVYLVIDK